VAGLADAWRFYPTEDVTIGAMRQRRNQAEHEKINSAIGLVFSYFTKVNKLSPELIAILFLRVNDNLIPACLLHGGKRFRGFVQSSMDLIRQRQNVSISHHFLEMRPKRDSGSLMRNRIGIDLRYGNVLVGCQQGRVRFKSYDDTASLEAQRAGRNFNRVFAHDRIKDVIHGGPN